jgi:uncharacterized phage protein gp47/JayE
MALNRPSLQNIIDRISGDFVAKISGATTLAMRSVLQVMARVYAAAVHLLYGYLDNITRQLFAKSATAAYLDRIGSELGVIRQAAAAADGVITVTGTAGTLIPAANELTSAAGNTYTTDADATIGLTGSIDVAVTCTAVGSAGNDSAGIVLTFTSPIAFVNSTAISAAGLAGGVDEESDTAYSARILARKRLAPHSGNTNDLEQWTLEVAGVTRAWAVPEWNGIGTVALYFVCDGQTPITPTAAQIAAVLAHVTSHTDSGGQTIGIPVTMLPGLFIAAPSIVAVNMTVRLSPNTADVQAEVGAQLADLYLREGEPGGTLYLSNLGEAISKAAGEDHSAITLPAADVGLAYNELAVPGAITWVDY